jgi:hypothetical protein
MLLNDKLFGERRRFERKTCLLMIGINNYKKLHTGYIRDLGLAGAFIEPQWGKERPDIGQKLLLAIPYGLKEGYVSIPAKIEWINSNGIGVQFQNAHARRKHL